MILRGDGDALLELTVLGYQYPDLVSGGWDANWLVIQGRVNANGQVWTFADPCLTTWEVQQLIEWMGVVEGGQAGRTLTFTEPNLAFAQVATPVPAVRVRLSHEAAFPWVTGDHKPTEIMCPVALNDWPAVVRSLRDQLAAYPVKVTRA